MLTVFVLVDVEDGKDLSVVRDQSLSHHLSRHHQMLQHLQSGAYHSGVPGVESICSSIYSVHECIDSELYDAEGEMVYVDSKSGCSNEERRK